MFDKDVGKNWHLRFRLKIEELQKQVDDLNMKNRILKRRIKKYGIFLSLKKLQRKQQRGLLISLAWT